MQGIEHTDIAEILARKLAGDELSEHEREILDRWLETSEDNLRLMEKMARGDSYREYRATKPAGGARKGIAAVEGRLRKRRLNRLAAVSGSVAAVILIAVFAMRTWVETGEIPQAGAAESVMLTIGQRSVALEDHEDDTAWEKYVERLPDIPGEQLPPSTVRIEIPCGKDFKVRLPDGTQVWLNAGSSIVYPERFTGPAREVRITGEAFFDVARDESLPFRVATDNGLGIEVLGTRFNVNSYHDGGATVVTLVEGSVKVVSGAESVVMRPNQQAVCDAGGALDIREVSDTRAYTAWTEGQFYYRSAPAAEILAALGRWYDVSFEYDTQLLEAAGDLTLIFSRDDRIADVLESLSRLTSLRFRLKDGIVYITR